MIRTLLRIVLLVVLVAAVAAFLIGYRMADRDSATEPERTVGTTGTVDVDRDGRDAAVDVDAARDAGARIGERVAAGANQAQLLARDAALTAKIKSKMALDDLVKARTIDVDTSDGVVTLSGSVESREQRERAVRLARETDGVTSVNDLLTIH
jgi:hyperosmotically inducible protein